MIRSLLTASVLAAASCLACLPAAHAAEFISGQQLARACAGKTPVESGSCDGFIAGALDEAVGNAELRATMCPPAGTKLSVLREALGRYGQQHAEDAKGSGVSLLHAMLKANYPCPGK